MGWLPTNLGVRPGLAVEMRPEGVIAARAEDGAATVSAVAMAELPGAAGMPQEGGRAAVVAAVRKTLEAVALKERVTTLVVPDTAVRVLLLDFDELPAKAVEAMPVVRFRLKKLLPFEVDEAVVSYQVMSSARGVVKVLAVAVPKEVLAEYEGVVRAAGFEPGAVMPSTLAACAGMTEADAATLLVNAGAGSVTTAIVRGAELLLHRTIDLEISGATELQEKGPASVTAPVGRAGEWPGVVAEGNAELQDAHLTSQAILRAQLLAEEVGAGAERESRAEMLPPLLPVEQARQAAMAREVTQAVSVAAAYFEDTLQTMPGLVLAAGTLGAERLRTMLRDAGFGEGEVQVREMMEPAMLAGGAVTARVPRGWIAGVRGALRS